MSRNIGSIEDGRNIDSERGTLTGEGSVQIVRETDQRRKDEFQVFPLDPASQKGLLTGDASYYDRPVIKKSVWSWDIPAYYVIGGISGSSMVMGAAATLLDRDELPRLVKGSRWVGVIGALVSSVLLVHDLGRPSRFLHMLRVFRPTSPMSMGSWILVSFSSFSGVALLAELVDEIAPSPVRWIGDSAAVLAGVFGLGLSGYTGVLVGNTTVPVWQRSHRVLPVVFLASAAAGATAVFDLWEGNARELRIAAIFGAVAKITELTSIHIMEDDLASVPEAVRPLREGFSGFLWQAGKVLSLAGLALAIFSHRSRRVRRINAVVGTLGAACVKFGVHYAGQKSALNPRATFHQQRSGQGAFEVTGKSAITGPADERAFHS